MAGGWLTGLGLGLQNAATTVQSLQQQQIQQQQQAIQNALQERELNERVAARQADDARLQQQADFQRGQFAVQYTPGGRVWSPEQVALLQRVGLQSFMQPEMAGQEVGAGPLMPLPPGGPEATVPGGMPTGRQLSVPTMSDRLRAAEISSQRRAYEVQLRLQAQQSIANQRMQLQRELEQSRDTTRRAFLNAQLQNLALRETELFNDATQREYMNQFGEWKALQQEADPLAAFMAISRGEAPPAAPEKTTPPPRPTLKTRPGGAAPPPPPAPVSTAPKVGDRKVFPNGKVGVWDGKGWVQQ